jgi:hypothetical protein
MDTGLPAAMLAALKDDEKKQSYRVSTVSGRGMLTTRKLTPY